MLIDYAGIDTTTRYKLMSQTVTPRPIAWVVTEEGGVVNIAPFSYFTPLSSEPPVVVVSVGHKQDGSPKDTLANIRAGKKCTICTVSPEHLEKMHLTGSELEKRISEAERFDIPTLRIHEGYPPVIEGADTALFCDFYQEIGLPESRTVPLILEVREQFVRDGLADERLGFTLKNIGRVGRGYHHTDDELTRF
jgi:flavin reductase (DIM6/NTAB) family NADH-FMN oxidoreductase RutF